MKIAKVFIASPGGLDHERNAARKIVNEVNSSHSEHWGCMIQLVGWEDTLPGYSRAQSIINSELDKCHYFVGILHDRWGTPTKDTDKKYSSGFEEEFERARERHDKSLMSDIVIYFKHVSQGQMKDPGEELKPVLKFKSRCIEDRKPAFREFAETGDFESLFRKFIENIGWREFEGSRSSLAEEKEGTPAETSNAVAAISGSFFGKTATEFIEELLTRGSDWDDTSAVEIARLRLLSVANWRSGNDEAFIGNHDGNLLFLARHKINFSPIEIRSLVDAAVKTFQSQNLPLWYWINIQKTGSVHLDQLDILAIGGDDPAP